MSRAPLGLFEADTGGSVIPIGKTRHKRYIATGEFRPPRKGEHYLSGAIIFAYRAPNDLSTPYWIAVEHTPVRWEALFADGWKEMTADDLLFRLTGSGQITAYRQKQS